MSNLFDDAPMARPGAAPAPSPSPGVNPYADFLPAQTSASPPAKAQTTANPYADFLPASPPMAQPSAPPSPPSGVNTYMTPAGAPGLFDDAPMAKPSTLPGVVKSAAPPNVERGTSIMDKIDAAVRGIADTATFGMADRIAAGLGALTGKGGTQGDYAGNLARERAINQFDEANNFAPRVAGQLAGGLAIPGAAAARGATVLERVGLGARAGAVQGGLYGAGSSEDLTNIPDVVRNAVTGAGIGGTIGVLAPAAVESAVGAGKFVRGVFNPEGAARSRVAQALSRDAGGQPLDESALNTLQSGGQPAIVADVGGEATRGLARSAANTSPGARAALAGATEPRYEAQAPRIAQFVSDLGGGSDATTTIEKLQDAAKAANRPAYAKAYAEGANGVWNDTLANLMQAPAVQDAVRGATKTGANRAVSEGFRPTKSPFNVAADGTITPRVNPDGSQSIPSLQFWDHVKRNLDDTVGRLLRSGEKSAAGDAITLRSQLVNALDQASPSYAKARGTAAEFFGAQDAVEAGAKFVSARGKNADFQRVIDNMSPPERQLFAHGFASKLADTVNAVPDRQNVLNKIYNSPDSREKVRMAMGLKNSAKLEAYLNVETAMEAVRKAVQGNSTTARQLAELGMAGGIGGGINYIHGGSLTSGAAVGAIMAGLARHGAIKIDARVAQKVGEMLASSDPGVYKKALAMTVMNKQLSNFIKSIAPALTKGTVPLAVQSARPRAAQPLGTPRQ
jgi:hypothetical protein